MTLFLGIDIGTSGIRSAVVNRAGELISMARAMHIAQPSIDINANLWWVAVENCLRAQVHQLEKAGIDPHEIAALAVDGTSGSMVLTDASLEPVSPALMYNSKGFVEEAAEIAKWATEPHITRGSNSALARAMRLARNATARPSHLLHQADFIAAKLMKQGGLSDYNNALKTGFDPDLLTWPSWVDQVISAHVLPDARPVGSTFGVINPSVAKALGLNTSIRVVAGTTDSVAAFLASAPLEVGIAVTSLGSTLAVKILSEKRIDAPEIGLYSHKIGNFWLVGGASNTGGAVLSSFFSPDEIADLSGLIDPEQPTGLKYYPLLSTGERFPINDPDFQGVMEPRPQQDHIFLAGLFEGISEVENKCYREIENRGGDYPLRIYSAGGGARNKVFAAIRSRILGTEMRVANHSEAAVGAAKIAIRGS